MAKIYGLFGSMTGKLADVVMSVRNGVQVARKYQPIVTNPQSPAQVAVRAKLKMLSQLSAAYAPIIAIRRQGSASARNIFTRLNFPFTDFDGQKAIIPLADVLLTSSTSGLPGMLVVREPGVGISVSLDDDASHAWERVVYTLMAKSASQEVYPLSSVVVSEAGEGGLFHAVLPYSPAAIAVYAYGVRFNNSAARVYFDELQTPTAQVYAQVLTSTRVSENDVTVSETRGVYMEVGETEAATTGVRSVIVSTRAINVTGTGAGALGTVEGGGSYPVGSLVTLNAIPRDPSLHRFLRWSAPSVPSIDGLEIASVTFTAVSSVDVAAVFGVVSE